LLLFFGLAQVAPGQDVPSFAVGRHKVQVNDRALGRKMAGEGARLIADYGGFELYDAPDSMTNLPADKAQLRDDYNAILLNIGRLDTTKPKVKALRKAAGSFAGNRLHLVQFAGPVQPAWRQSLLDAGVRIVSYIPQNTYLVYGDAAGLGRVQTQAAAPRVQWEAAYLDDFKIHPSAKPASVKTDQFAIQLVSDDAANAVTLDLISQLKLAPISRQRRVLNYVNVVARVAPASLAQIAARPDVISIQPYGAPRQWCERQDQIVAGNLSDNAPAGPGYLAWLQSRGFAQSQFGSFAVDMSDSGIDDGTTHPNHFGLYAGGTIAGTNSRVIYNRLEGTANPGSTLAGCDGHGNINAHIVGGCDDRSGFPFEDSSGYHYGLGVCPFVSLGSSVIFDPTNFTSPSYQDLMSQAYKDSARICNNSWGDSGKGRASQAGLYNLESQEYDALVRDAQPEGSTYPAAGNQQMVIVFAAGNEGPDSETVSPPGTAKNVITVGAADNVQPFGGANDGADLGDVTDSDAENAGDIVYFSSRGPCADGRLKPDLVAPGTHVSGGVSQAANPGADGTAETCFLDISTNFIGVDGGSDGSRFFPNTGQQFYTASSGTSHAAPCVSGGCALLRQYFINQGWTPPSPAMTKAWLMNAARYLTGDGANDSLWSPGQGMGELNLGTAFDGVPRFLRDEVSGDMFTASGQTRVFTGAIANTNAPFRVTVAWTDAPGSTTGAAYNNDLDLTVTAGGNTYLGNVFSGAFSTTGGSADPYNNVESVFLPAGVSGAFTVTVTAAGINSVGVPGAAGQVNQDFALVVYNAGPAPMLAAAGAVLTQESCQPANGAVDPGETVSVDLTIQNTGSAATTNLVATLLAVNGVTSPSGPQTYGALAPGSAATAGYSFQAEGSCGGVVIATLRLQDGTAKLGTVSYVFHLGKQSVTTNFSESFNEVTPPALPNGWISDDTEGEGVVWTSESGVGDSVPNAVYCPDSDFTDAVFLYSPTMTLPSGPSQLSFRQSFNLEDQYDGGVLQISIGGSTFEDILAAGGSFVTGGYVEQILSDYDPRRCADDPLVGDNAWSGTSDGFITTLVNLPANAEGKTIQLRWACGTDCVNEALTGTGGWWMDNFLVFQTNLSCCTGVTVPAPVILFPTNGFTNNNGSLTVTGTGVAGATVSVLDGTNLLGKAAVNSSGKFSLPVKLSDGSHLLTASQTSGGISSAAGATVAVTLILAPVITAEPQSLTGFLKETVSFSSGAYGAAPLRFVWQKNGTNIPGATATNLTLSGLAGNSAASYWMVASNSYGWAASQAAVLTLEPNPFTNLTGTYYGLFSESPARFESSGYLTLTLHSLGSFSGSILNAGGSRGFSGGFSIAGQARVVVAPWTIIMNLDLSTNDTKQILGVVSNAAWSAPLQAGLGIPGASNVGKFTMVFENTNDGSASPGGDGYGTVSINAAGTVSWKGVLADNTSVAPSAVGISKSGRWPLYVALYGKLGSISGWVTNFANDGALEGEANWFRVGAYGKLYPRGFTNAALPITGSVFAPGTSKMPALEPTNLFLTLSGGGLAAPLTNHLTLYDTGKFATNGGDAPKLSLSVTPGTGLISGSFLDPQTRQTSAIKGVVLQEQGAAAGFFLSTNATGLLLLTH